MKDKSVYKGNRIPYQEGATQFAFVTVLRVNKKIKILIKWISCNSISKINFCHHNYYMNSNCDSDNEFKAN